VVSDDFHELVGTAYHEIQVFGYRFAASFLPVEFFAGFDENDVIDGPEPVFPGEYRELQSKQGRDFGNVFHDSGELFLIGFVKIPGKKGSKASLDEFLLRGKR
jgi:hypothetical protein